MLAGHTRLTRASDPDAGRLRPVLIALVIALALALVAAWSTPLRYRTPFGRKGPQ